MREQAQEIGQEVRQLCAAHPVRKGRAKKEAFRADALAFLQGAGWNARVETVGRLPKSHNVVVGEPEKAKVLFTAHYDTPAGLLVPNFLAPRNLFVSLLYQIVLGVLLCVVPVALAWAVLFWVGNFALFSAVLFLGCFAMMWLLMAGPANPHNQNDNTSGVAVLLEIARTLPEELREDVALVLFDNEELGLMGSAAFAKHHPALQRGALVVNYDCVGVGEHFLFVQKRDCRKDEALNANLASAFAMPEGKELLLEKSPFTMYPSDQMNFKRGIGVAALKRVPLVGLCLGRIHTPRDTVWQEENLALLRDGSVNLAAQLAGKTIGV